MSRSSIVPTVDGKDADRMALREAGMQAQLDAMGNVKADSNKRRRASAKDQIAAQIFEAQETIKRNMTRRRVADEVARMSGNEAAADME